MDMTAPDRDELKENGRQEFEHVMNSVQGDLSYAAYMLTKDGGLRAEYSKLIAIMADEYRSKASAKLISWHKASRTGKQRAQ